MTTILSRSALVALVLLAVGCQEPTAPAPTTPAATPAASADAPAADGTAVAAPVTAMPQGALTVVQWGAQDAKVGEGFNQQPDGSSGLWFELSQALPPVEVTGTFGDKPLLGVVSSGKIVTATVPTSYLAAPGSYPIELVVPSTGARISVGSFTVKGP
jgi:hypothetical protein